jgi:predicted mannosyl-3-phosphoglycerate phosphatase (HAD superfamily)
MKIIFLDIDGVLNNYNTLGEGLNWESNAVKILKRIIKETGAKVVLSSTWRRGSIN